MTDVRIRKIFPVTLMRGDSRKDTKLLREMYQEARNFLGSFAWCERIVKAYYGLGIGGVVAVFFFEIRPSRRDVDRRLWVVVGDLPPAYLVTDKSPTPAEALKNYILEMRGWVKAVRAGKSVEDLIPVNVLPTKLWARRLEKRLDFLASEILPLYGDR